jgi:phenylacetate-coenzyme A ligase PaaK-like adenylate-forming protein
MKKFNNLFDNIGRINYQLLLKKKIKLTIKNSKFYKKKLLNFKNIKFSIKEFEKIPFTTKTELLEDQKKYSPFGQGLLISL